MPDKNHSEKAVVFCFRKCRIGVTTQCRKTESILSKKTIYKLKTVFCAEQLKYHSYVFVSISKIRTTINFNFFFKKNEY